jgi:hypothetical protein
MTAGSLLHFSNLTLALTVFIFLLVKMLSIARFKTSNKTDLFLKSLFFYRDRSSYRTTRTAFFIKSERTNIIFYIVLCLELVVAVAAKLALKF